MNYGEWYEEPITDGIGGIINKLRRLIGMSPITVLTCTIYLEKGISIGPGESASFGVVLPNDVFVDLGVLEIAERTNEDTP